MLKNMSFRRYFWGFVLIGIGILLLLDNLQVLEISEFAANFWPVLLMGVGLLIIFGKRPNRVYVSGDVQATEVTDVIKVSHTFGDVRLKLDSKNFCGGEISNVIGNIEVDLENIVVQAGQHRLKMNGVFGDLIIILPKDAAVSVLSHTTFGTARIKDRSSAGVSGQLSYTSRGFEDAANKLSIEVHQTFGDVRVF